MLLIDTHAHLNLSDFKNDYKEAAQRALDKNVWVVNVGTDFKSSKRAVEISNEYEKGIFAAVGIHPTDFGNDFDKSHTQDCAWDKQKFLELAKNKKAVAIGECGLDYYRIKDKEARGNQKELFLKQIELAHEVGKPLIIHCRDAHNDLLEILKANNSKLKTDRAGVMHFFGGPGAWENVNEYLDLGFYISFSGIITFNKQFKTANAPRPTSLERTRVAGSESANYYELINKLPLERILIETDSPFAAPVPYRGQRNEPAYVVEIAKKMAEILGISFERVCEITAENTEKVFQI